MTPTVNSSSTTLALAIFSSLIVLLMLSAAQQAESLPRLMPEPAPRLNQTLTAAPVLITVRLFTRTVGLLLGTKKGGVCAFIDAEHALDPEYAKKLGVDIASLLVSQPDTGEQALEIVESLVRSGKIDV